MRPINGKLKRNIWVLLVFLFSISGCSPETQLMNEPTQTGSVIPSPTLASTEIPTRKSNITLEASTSPEPTTPSVKLIASTKTPANETVTISPSVTPLPTLSIAESRRYVLELLQNNGGCKLPCFWGITPGKTSLDHSLSLLKNLGWEGGWFYDGNVFATGEDLDGQSLDIYLLNQDDRVDKIMFGLAGDDYASHAGYYSTPQLFESMGRPSQIWITLFTAPFNQSPYEISYDLWVFYQNEAILAKYGGISVRSGSNYRICPNLLSYGVSTEPESRGALILTIGHISEPPEDLMKPFGLFDGMLTVEEALGLSVEDFYNRVLEKPEVANCFMTPREIWP